MYQFALKGNDLAYVRQLHTHTRLTGPFSRTTQVSRYQKGKTYLDFTELRDSEWHWYVYCVRQLLEYNFPIWSPRYVYLKHTHTQPFNGLWSGTTRVGQYQKKHSPTHTHTDHRTSVIIFLHLQQSMASTLFILRA